MDKKTEAMKLALEALMEATKIHASSCKCSACRAVIVAQDALAEQPAPKWMGARFDSALHEQPAQQQEPVAYMNQNGVIHPADYEWEGAGNILTPLYTSPPASKPWVGLSTDEIYDMYNEPRSDAEMVEFARAIEAKLKEKNNG